MGCGPGGSLLSSIRVVKGRTCSIGLSGTKITYLHVHQATTGRKKIHSQNPYPYPYPVPCVNCLVISELYLEIRSSARKTDIAAKKKLAATTPPQSPSWLAMEVITTGPDKRERENALARENTKRLVAF